MSSSPRYSDDTSRKVIDVATGILGWAALLLAREAFDELVSVMNRTGVGIGSLAAGLVALAGGGSSRWPRRGVHRMGGAHRFRTGLPPSHVSLTPQRKQRSIAMRFDSDISVRAAAGTGSPNHRSHSRLRTRCCGPVSWPGCGPATATASCPSGPPPRRARRWRSTPSDSPRSRTGRRGPLLRRCINEDTYCESPFRTSRIQVNAAEVVGGREHHRLHHATASLSAAGNRSRHGATSPSARRRRRAALSLRPRRSAGTADERRSAALVRAQRESPVRFSSSALPNSSSISTTSRSCLSRIDAAIERGSRTRSAPRPRRRVIR